MSAHIQRMTDHTAEEVGIQDMMSRLTMQEEENE